MSLRHIFIVVLLAAALILSAGCTQLSPAVTGTPAATTTTTTITPTVISASAAAAPATSTAPAASTGTGKQVRLQTNMGTITIALAQDMPITTGNFEKLVSSGYYNGVIFHRVIDGFMIQGGDPTGTGRGGPGYAIKDEFTKSNRNDRGTIAMAKSCPNTGGSQFFINLVNNNFLDTKHPVFGHVTEGMDVVDAIGKVKVGAGSRPLQNVTIIKAEII